jgi:hypothetical protein
MMPKALRRHAALQSRHYEFKVSIGSSERTRASGAMI